MKQPAAVRRVAPALLEANGEYAAGFPIGVVADLLGVTEQTLRLYERQGLVKPARRNRERYYCPGDVQSPTGAVADWRFHGGPSCRSRRPGQAGERERHQV